MDTLRLVTLETNNIYSKFIYNIFQYREKLIPKQQTQYLLMQDYMRTLIDPLYKRLGYQMLPTDKHLDIYLRTLAVAWACGLDHPECKQETKRQYSEWMEKLNPDEPSENPYVKFFIK